MCGVDAQGVDGFQLVLYLLIDDDGLFAQLIQGGGFFFQSHLHFVHFFAHLHAALFERLHALQAGEHHADLLQHVEMTHQGSFLHAVELFFLQRRLFFQLAHDLLAFGPVLCDLVGEVLQIGDVLLQHLQGAFVMTAGAECFSSVFHRLLAAFDAGEVLRNLLSGFHHEAVELFAGGDGLVGELHALFGVLAHQTQAHDGRRDVFNGFVALHLCGLGRQSGLLAAKLFQLLEQRTVLGIHFAILQQGVFQAYHALNTFAYVVEAGFLKSESAFQFSVGQLFHSALKIAAKVRKKSHI